MSLFDQINDHIKTAMKAREKGKLEAFRSIKKVMIEAKSAKGADSELSDDEVLKIIQKLAKQGSESAESLLKDEIQVYHQIMDDYNGVCSEWFKHDKKILKLIQAPVLVSTIDYLIPATDGVRGGRQIAPMLRLLTSDLVLDEPDDFGLEDLPALCRLVNWAGMLGARLLLSTATISPELASALFDAYQQGRSHYTRANGENTGSDAICCAWFDEYKKPISSTIHSLESFNLEHEQFVNKRITKLKKDETGLRKAKIIPVNMEENTKPSKVFAHVICRSIQQLHKNNFVQHHSEKKISIGLVRMANIDPLVAVAKQLYAIKPDTNTQVYYCVYHSQYPLMLRSYIETHLDKALTRHNEVQWWKDSGLQKIVKNSDAENHIFVVLATSVAEVGRDHDYDWAIVEPSSMRSIIQLAGRIQRHRKQSPKTDNIHILDKNFKALKGILPAYLQPGFESKKRQFYTHQLSQLLDKNEYKSINAIPRIKKVLPPFALTESDPPQFKSFNELEHIVQYIRLFGIPDKEENCAKLWWECNTTWNGEIQRNQPFRRSQAMEDYNLNLSYSNKLIWQKKKQGEYPEKYEPTNDIRQIKLTDINMAIGNIPWFELSVAESIEKIIEKLGVTEDIAYKKFSHIQLRKNNADDIERWKYHHHLGVFKELIKDEYINEE